MLDFEYYTPTKVFFGKDREKKQVKLYLNMVIKK